MAMSQFRKLDKEFQMKTVSEEKKTLKDILKRTATLILI